MKAMLFIIPVLLCSCMRSYDEPLKIAFSKQISGNYQVCTINIDGTEETQLTSASGEDSGAPSWSSDGEHIVFSKSITALSRAGIWVMNYDGTGMRLLVQNADSPCFQGKPR